MDIYTTANLMKSERKTIFDLPIRVTWYARVSTKREEQETSIDSQIAYFTQLIKNNTNWVYVDGYADRVRGERAANRDEFMRMIADGRNGMFDLIITKEVSRFARDTIDSLSYAREMLRCGVGIFFQNDNICTIDTDAELRLTIMSSIAQDEVRKLSDRVKWGHKRAIEKGRVAGNSRIFGYDKKDCKLTVNETEAQMVRIIFELYSTGNYSTHKIADFLYEKGYRGRNGTKIQHNTILGIIRNPKYKGYYCGNKVKIVDYRTKEQKFLPPTEWVMYKDETGEVVPAIVSEEIWETCNKIDKERSQTASDSTRKVRVDSVLSGKVWCTVHNTPYWRTSYRHQGDEESTPQWLCSEKRRKGASACPSVSIKESEIYSILSKVFKDMADNIQDYIATFIQIYKETDSEENLRGQVTTLQARLDKENNKREKLLELYMDGDITKAEFSKRNESISLLISNLEDEIVSLEKKYADDTEQLKSIKKIEDYFLNMYSPDFNMTKEQVEEMVKALIEKIHVTPIEGNVLKLDIKLKTGENQTVNYTKIHAKKGNLRKTNEADLCCHTGNMCFTI